MFPSASPRGTLRSRGNKTHCFPWDQSLSAYCRRFSFIKVDPISSKGLMFYLSFSKENAEHVIKRRIMKVVVLETYEID